MRKEETCGDTIRAITNIEYRIDLSLGVTDGFGVLIKIPWLKPTKIALDDIMQEVNALISCQLKCN